MASVRDLLKFKRDDRLFTVGPMETVLEAIRKMSDQDVGSLIVTRDREILGIVTERDYARKIVLEGRTSAETPVAEIMRTRVRCVGLDSKIDDCRLIMTEDNIRYVPVIENDTLVGLVSIGDVIGHAVAEQEYLIDQLTRYIAGTHISSARQRAQ